MPVTFKGKLRLEDAQRLSRWIEDFLVHQLGFAKAQTCGSVRRQRPEVGDLDIIVDGPLGLLRSSAAAGAGFRWVEGGDEKATLAYEPTGARFAIQINILRTGPERWGAAMLYFTGPAGYNIAYRARAKRMGMLLNENGLFRLGQCIASKTEEDIYKALGKKYKSPEDRGT